LVTLTNDRGSETLHPARRGAQTCSDSSFPTRATVCARATAAADLHRQPYRYAIENFFNNGGTLAPAFVPLFGLTGSNLTSGLDQLSGLRALERDEDIPGPTLCLERGGPTLVQVWCVVADCQRVAV
jgi:hypothetical protein